MIIIGSQPFNEIPIKKSSVIFTTIKDIKKPIIPSERNRIGRVISLNIHPTIRLTSPSMNINIKSD